MGEQQQSSSNAKCMLVREKMLQAIVQMSMQDGSLSASLYVILDAIEEHGNCELGAVEQAIEEIHAFEKVLHGLQDELMTLRNLSE
ncbi:hypothetical protein KDA_73780 [Dictyobacter alpinus]|uniref:Uncharacterized protein n=1 Tax=Dictyobacter alpinus TaxID=2014873 RepID=A0A402BKL7_9CHLR|nr:hypothetical protein [Dictyobacter alpinus]GCE31894.1 hypothetical protein KDA_73780 [Dictyobacter alpinus]